MEEWLPGAVAHSVVTDRFRCAINVPRRQSTRTTSVATVTKSRQTDAWAGMLASGEVASRAELARRVGVSRARVTQVLGPADTRHDRREESVPLGEALATRVS